MTRGRRPRAAERAHRRRGYVLLPVALLLGVIAALAFTLSREGLVGARIVEAGALAKQARYVAEAGLAHARHLADNAACTGYDLPDTPFGEHSYRATFTPTAGSPVDIAATGTLADGTARTLLRRQVRVFETEEVATLQPDAADGIDVQLERGNPDGNYGQDSQLQVLPDYVTSLLRFDLSGITAGARIVSATLELYQETNYNGDPSESISAHRVTSEWQEGSGTGNVTGDGADWNTRDGTTAWATPGGDHEATPAAVMDSIPGTGWKSWNLTGLVADWTSGSAPNHGLLLKASAGLSRIKFSSSDSGSPSQRPRLTVTYACECGGNGQTTLLQPGATEGADTFLDGWYTPGDYGAEDTLAIQPPAYRPLLRFDLSSVPASAVVVDARLELYQTAGNVGIGASVDAFRVTSDWVEGTGLGQPTGAGATWDTRDGSTAWAAAGGDHEATAVASSPAENGSGWRTWDLGTLVAAWVSGAVANHGVMLKGVGNVYSAAYQSSDAADASLHPKLTVDWYCPCGADCSTGLPVDAHYLDSFTLACTEPDAYAGSDGSLDWSATAWTEVGDNDDPCAGSIRLESDAGDLRLRLGGGQGAERAVDLGEFSGATLRMLVRADQVGSGERLSVEVSADGVAWSEVASVDGPADDVDYRSLAIDITAHASPDTRIRLTSLSSGAASNFYVDDVRIDQAPVSSGTMATLDALADTYVYENQPGGSYGTQASVTAGKDGSGPGREYRALLRFDVGALPAGATVNSATLRLYVEGGEGGDVGLDLYRAGTSWDEATATWTGTGGGATAGSAYDGATVSTTTSGWTEWSVPPALVHEWMDGVSPNDGLVLVSTSHKGRNALFASRESTTLANRPQLVVDYTEP